MPKAKSQVPPDHEVFDYLGQKLEIGCLCVLPLQGYQGVEVGRVSRFTPKMVVVERLPLRPHAKEYRAYPPQLVRLSDDQAMMFKLKLKT